MKTLREKITFVLTLLAYLLFHLRLGPDAGSLVAHTFKQILSTAPYAIGFTYLFVVFIRRTAGGVWPPWDRIARIFLTLGIIFAFFFALYEYGERANPESKEKPATGLHFYQDEIPKVMSYLA